MPASTVMRINSAEEHFATLVEAIETIAPRIRVIQRVSDDGHRIESLLNEVVPECPAAWESRVTDVLFNLRAALDCLLWELVLYYNGDTPEARQMTYPTIFSRDEWERHAHPIFSLTPARVVSNIEETQPFAGPLRAEEHLLGLLTRLSNVVKHRSILRPIPMIDNWKVEGLMRTVDDGDQSS